MSPSKWSDFGNIWSTVRELDVNAIRDEAERVLMIACVGQPAALHEVDRLLHSNSRRYGPSGASALNLVPLDKAGEAGTALSGASMLLLAVDARTPLSAAEAEAFGRLERLSLPFLVVLLFGERPAADGAMLPYTISAHTLTIADPASLDAPDRLAAAILERLPGELHLAGARRLPALRPLVARDLVNGASFSNATYALASGLPEQIPILNVPFAAADMLMLTKNQALLVYRLALAYGAPPDFQARIREVVPVIGGAFLWRQAARTLVGLIPIWGLAPKVAIAYAGTYTTGVVAWRWFDTGEVVDSSQLKYVIREALDSGRARANELIAQSKARTGGFFERLKQRLPGRKSHEISPPKE